MKVECHTPDLPGCPRPSAHVAPLPSFQRRGWGQFAPVPLQGTLACPRTCSRVLGTMNRVRLCGLHLQGAGSWHHHQRSRALLGEAVKRHGKFDPLPSVNAEGFHAAGGDITLGGPGLVSPIPQLRTWVVPRGVGWGGFSHSCPTGYSAQSSRWGALHILLNILSGYLFSSSSAHATALGLPGIWLHLLESALLPGCSVPVVPWGSLRTHLACF